MHIGQPGRIDAMSAAYTESMDSPDRPSSSQPIPSGVLSRISAGRQDPDVDALAFDEVLWVRDHALSGRLVAPTIVLQLVEAYFEARGSRAGPDSSPALGTERPRERDL